MAESDVALPLGRHRRTSPTYWNPVSIERRFARRIEYDIEAVAVRDLSHVPGNVARMVYSKEL